jgi:uncharacterized repeat protein (TIGR01451 family)
MSARTRRAIALSWSVLFILSLVLQYATFALAPSVLAVHDEGVFELDGNALASGAPGDDWSNLANADASVFITDPLSQTTDKIFTGGGSKDDLNTTQWAWTTGSVPDKDNIEHAYAALYDDVLYFGADRFANNGDAQMGFWFFKSGVGLTGGPSSGGFAPAHSVGDLLVLSHFENGGTVSTIELYEWVGSGGDTNGTLDLLGSGQVCTAAPVADKACAIANVEPTAAPWSYDAKSGPDDIFPANSFFEGGLDLAQVYGGNPPCFSSFLVETRSSQSVDATLKDFANGDFNTCVPPTIGTDASESSIQLGGSVTDTATLTGNDGPASGAVRFFVCGPNGSATACASGGTQVGGAVTVTTSPGGGTATSAAFTPTATGWYCFRAVYTPDDASQYLEGSHTNATTECFRVVEARISITKTADPVGPVNAGDTIGFDITVTNEGDGPALGVSMTDPLPAGLAWLAGTPTGDTTGVTCGIAAGTLTCTDGSMAPGDSFSVHLSAVTDATDCATITNTASVTTTNDGSDAATASVVVRCPDVQVVKDAPKEEIPAGQNLVFTITTTNIGAGVAHDVTLSDTLPAGFDWTENSADCSISGGVLSCDFGDLNPGASASVTLTAPTSADPGTGNVDCSEGTGSITIPNVARASSSNEGGTVLGNNTDGASIDVLCSGLLIDKSFTGNTAGTDPDLGVPAANIGDTLHYTLAYAGAGPLTNAVITDVIPAGLEYVAGSAAGDANFTFISYTAATRTLRWTAATLPDPTSGSVTYDVTVTAAAPELAQPLVNVATIDSDQTPPDSDTASVAVLAPPLELTPPPTSAVAPAAGTGNPGFALMLILLGVAAATLVIGFVTPVPARAARGNSRR